MDEAQFFVGQIIYHKLFNYRGVIFDVDFEFLGSDDWYDKVARSRPSKNQPWYHVLVDNASHQTYVAECNITMTSNDSPINNPMLDYYFEQYKDGVYLPIAKKN